MKKQKILFLLLSTLLIISCDRRNKNEEPSQLGTINIVEPSCYDNQTDRFTVEPKYLGTQFPGDSAIRIFFFSFAQYDSVTAGLYGGGKTEIYAKHLQQFLKEHSWYSFISSCPTIGNGKPGSVGYLVYLNYDKTKDKRPGK